MCEDLEEQMDVKAALDKDGVDTKRKWLAAARAERNAIIEFETEDLSRSVTKNVKRHVTREINVCMKK